jgi:ubiquitin carboxyl-terminal hydrolase 48
MIRLCAKSVGLSGACSQPGTCNIVESLHRKMDYDLTEITIRVLGSEDPDPTPETYTKNAGPVMIDSRQTSILTYRSRNVEQPQRQSKRIRTVRRRVRRIGISKQMSVKEIKLLVRRTLSTAEACVSCPCCLVAGGARHSDHLPAAVLPRS